MSRRRDEDRGAPNAPRERTYTTYRATHRRSRSPRRHAILLGSAAAAVLLAALLSGAFGSADAYPAPSAAGLAGLTPRQRIVAIAESQVGYHTEPAGSYCNKFSAYWHAGASDCPAGERDEEWCADFAAWAWRKAGVRFDYGYGPGEIDGGAASFYEWGVANGEWHPAGSGYVAAPGDVAVYGLSLGESASAAHVAVVVQDPSGQQGPDVVNGDGDRTAFSAVESGSDQLRSQSTGRRDAILAGYVSPPLAE